MSLKKALVIGSQGNIGKPLVNYLKMLNYDVLESDIKPGWRPHYVVADIRNSGDLLPIFDWKPDVVFHLAAMVSRVTCEQASSLAVDINLAGTQNVLDLTKRIGAKLIYFSSSEVYGPSFEIMSENNKPNPNNRYGLTKFLSEALVEYEVNHYNLRAVTLRPFMMYDEEEDMGDHRSAMIRFASNLALCKPIDVHKGGARSWFHVSDAVRSIEAAVHLDDYHIINIGNSDVRSTVELAHLICKELGAKKELINYVDLPEKLTPIKRPCLEKQTNLLGITPRVSLEDGIKRVCERVLKRLMY